MLTQLEDLARAAAAEAEGEGDWFDPELIESREPISSAPAARRMIAALSPQTVLALLAVCKAAEDVDSTLTGDVLLPQFQTMRDALKALDKP